MKRKTGHVSGYTKMLDAARSLTPSPSPGGRGERRAEMVCQPFPECSTKAGSRRRVGTDAPCRSTRRAFLDPRPAKDYRPREMMRFNVSLSRVCQPRPPWRKCASTLRSNLRVTCSLVGAFCGPRCPGRRTVAPRQNAVTTFGSFGSYGSVFGSKPTGASARASAFTRAQSVRLRFDGLFIDSPFGARGSPQRNRADRVPALDVNERQQHVLDRHEIQPSVLALARRFKSQFHRVVIHATGVLKVEAVLGEVRSALIFVSGLVRDDHALIVTTNNSECKFCGRPDRMIE
jgi:hypothetical protein